MRSIGLRFCLFAALFAVVFAGIGLSPGEPPLDAATVLGLPPELPETVAEMNEESLAVAGLVVQSLPDRPEARAPIAGRLIRRDEGPGPLSRQLSESGRSP